LKAENDVDRGDVTSGGRLFHVFAAVTGKARSPMVRSRVGGTTDAEVDDERRRRRPGSSATSCIFVSQVYCTNPAIGCYIK